MMIVMLCDRQGARQDRRGLNHRETSMEHGASVWRQGVA